MTGDLTSQSGRVLVVDDDAAIRHSLRDLLALAGYATSGAASAAEARRMAESEEPALAILDLVLPDGDGIRLFTDLRASWPGMPALILTGYVETRSIVEAMRAGAHDYLTKPVDPEVLLSACREALSRRAVPVAAAAPEPLLIVGDSAAMTRVRESVERLGRSRPRGILIVGEDGVGKTWLARAIHAASVRRMAPCLLHSCALAPQPAVDLLGAPGSTAGGLLRAAGGGTLILDEVARLGADAQMQLLQRIEASAAGAPLVIGLMRSPEGASPLTAWLGRATIALPPLHERTSDVLLLARHFLAESGHSPGRAGDGFTSAAEHELLAHTWPGNVHELKEAVGRASLVAPGGVIRPEHLRLRSTTSAGGFGPEATTALRPLREIEDAYIDHVLAATHGNRTRAARILGVARETLRTRMLTRQAAS